ncbi:Cadherin-related tumor suppressor [Portunus trituberculatus]|uniref:Cadherin-related tumor suppressor n=1 Tax=Portunus trituberculatus TaxID=210409 RepID=A0A5B7ICQ8_PORTR|nr:Cadherin-related tumor suppressor [Portunus trituberculatus]
MSHSFSIPPMKMRPLLLLSACIVLAASLAAGGPGVVADGAEGTVRYQLNDDTNFGINSAGVIYSIRHLDHEGSGGRYLLQVTAEEKDQGDVSGWTRPVTAQVTLQVTDAPEPPRFDSPHYKFTVSEFASQGKEI